MKTQPSWQGRWRGLDLTVERRTTSDDAGATLRVFAPDETDTAREWLRFDLFARDPHWHLDPHGRDERFPLEARFDPIAEIVARLRDETHALLERAGAQTAVLENVRRAIEAPPAERETETLVLRDAERALRHRPARLDELDPAVLRSRRSEKWHTHPEDVLPAWVAEMDFPIAAPIEDELRRFVDAGDVGYPIGLRETGLPEVFSARMQERFDWQPDPAGVEILSEVVQGMYLAVEAFTRPSEGIVVQTPIYPPFLGCVRDLGRTLVENRMRLESDGLVFDLEALAAQIDSQSRLLLFCNPHNPSGRVFRRTELESIAELAEARDLIVVSDEIHADLVFDGREHIPFASLSPEIARRTVTLTSASKAFNIPGLRTAVAHFGDTDLQARFNTVIHRYLRGGLGLHGLYATMAAWRFGQPWLDEVVPYLAGNRDVAEEALAARIPEIRFLRPEATYLAWLDCRELDLAGRPAAHFFREGRVALSEGRLFGPGWEGFARMNLGTSRAILRDVVERIARSLGR